MTKSNNLIPKEENAENVLTFHNFPVNPFLKSVEISLCHNEILKNPEKAEEIFNHNLVKKEEFFKDPWKMLNNTNLLLCYEERLYTYNAAVPLLFSFLIYGEKLPSGTLEDLNKNNSKGMFSFLRSSKQNDISKIKMHHHDDMSHTGAQLLSKQTIDSQVQDKRLSKRESICKVRCFSPPSEQLKLLNLKEGRNEIKFVCNSRLSGQQTLAAEIYLWDETDKIVISDVDGTITRSDVLGHIMPMIGKDWSQEGVTELFTNIEKNGYKILYLTARAICQSSQTKNYIQSLFQSKK
jgi:phosphatidate phosphatase LPIN